MIASNAALTGDRSKVYFIIRTDQNLQSKKDGALPIPLAEHLDKMIRSFPELRQRDVKVLRCPNDEKLCAQLHHMTKSAKDFAQWGNPKFVLLTDGVLGNDNENTRNSELQYTGMYSDLRGYRSTKFASFMVLGSNHAPDSHVYLPQRLNHMLPRTQKGDGDDEENDNGNEKDKVVSFQVMPSYFALPRVNIGNRAEAEKYLRLYLIGLIGELGFYPSFNINSLNKREKSLFDSEHLASLLVLPGGISPEISSRIRLNTRILQDFANGMNINEIAKHNRIRSPKKCFGLIHEYIKSGPRAITSYDPQEPASKRVLSQENSQALRDFFQAAPSLPTTLNAAHIMKLAFDFWGLDLGADEANHWLRDNQNFLNEIAQAKGHEFTGNLGDLVMDSRQAHSNGNGQAQHTKQRMVEPHRSNGRITIAARPPIGADLLVTYLKNIDRGIFTTQLAAQELAPRLGIKVPQEMPAINDDIIQKNREELVNVLVPDDTQNSEHKYTNTERYLLLYTLLAEKSSTGLGQLLRNAGSNPKSTAAVNRLIDTISNHDKLARTNRVRHRTVEESDKPREIGTIITRQAKALGKLDALVRELKMQVELTQPTLETIISKHLAREFSYPTYRHFAKEHGITITNLGPGGRESYIHDQDLPAILGLANKYAKREQLTYDLLGDIIEFVSGHRYESHQSLYNFAKEHNLTDHITHKAKPGAPRRTKGHEDEIREEAQRRGLKHGITYHELNSIVHQFTGKYYKSMGALWRLASRLGINMRYDYNGDHLRMNIDAVPLAEILSQARRLTKNHELTPSRLNKLIFDRMGRWLEDFELEAFALEHKLHLTSEAPAENNDGKISPFTLRAERRIQSEELFQTLCSELGMGTSHFVIDRPSAKIADIVTRLATEDHPNIPGTNLRNSDHRKCIRSLSKPHLLTS